MNELEFNQINADKLDSLLYGTENIVAIPSGSVLTKEQTEAIYELAKTDYLCRVSVVDENNNIITTTDFTDEQKNLEVWKATGLQEEDFYK